jgi:hypothetical protein
MNADIPYCNTDDIIAAQGLEHKPEDLQLFNDSLKLSILTALYKAYDLPSVRAGHHTEIFS